MTGILLKQGYLFLFRLYHYLMRLHYYLRNLLVFSHMLPPNGRDYGVDMGYEPSLRAFLFGFEIKF